MAAAVSASVTHHGEEERLAKITKYEAVRNQFFFIPLEIGSVHGQRFRSYSDKGDIFKLNHPV